MKRHVILLAGVISLLAGMWAGLLRAGWVLPVWQPALLIYHGPLMVCGFLGTVIAFERAVALQKRWTFAGPAATGAGGLLLAFFGYAQASGVLFVLGAMMLTVVSYFVYRLHPAPFHAVIAGGSLFFTVGCVLWFIGWPVFRAVPWWIGFLLATIVGERIELNRLLQLSKGVKGLLFGCLAVMAAGMALSLLDYAAGMRLLGVGALGSALWLLRWDIAKRMLKTAGLTKFTAICLFTGYLWLAVGGVLLFTFGAEAAGMRYDAMLHAVFLGFVMSMIFGHAPIIAGAVLRLPVNFTPGFYTHVVMLHCAVIIRIGGDLLGIFTGYRWGALLTSLAVLLFLVNTERAVYRSRQERAAGRP